MPGHSVSEGVVLQLATADGCAYLYWLLYNEEDGELARGIAEALIGLLLLDRFGVC